jgi:tetratricopeptide (TPR) repeat protein
MGLQALAQSAETAPTTTLPLVGLEKLADNADKLADLLVSLMVTALVVLGVLATFALAYQVVRLRFRRQLVVEDIINASGLEDLDGKLAGLSQLVREQFVAQMSRLTNKVQESLAAADLKSYSAVIDSTPLPRNVPDQRLTELMGSLTTFAGDKAGPALQLLNAVLLRPKGTKVRTTLQRQGDVPGRLGVTFEIADLRENDVPIPITVREAESARPAPVEPQTNALSKLSVNSVPEPPATVPELDGQLSTVGRLGDAVKYLERVLQLDSRNRQSADQEDAETVTHLLLGAQYEAIGALEEAKTEYIEALKAGGQNERTIDLLGKVLRQDRSVEARYLNLFEPTIRQLVVELAKRELVNLPWFTLVRRVELHRVWLDGLVSAIEAQRRRDRALVHNYIGSLYHTSAPSFPMFLPHFQKLAIIEFKEALRLDEKLYQAHENLAYVFGWIEGEVSADEARSGRERALLHFDEALALLESGERVPEGEERLAATRLLNVGRATIAVELAESDDAIKQAKQSVEDVFSSWDEASEPRRRVLYNLASWYGVLLQSQQANEGDLTRARRLLAYAMARTPTVAPSQESVDRFWQLASSDSDLRCVTNARRLLKLRLVIDRKQIVHQQLPYLKGAEFEQIMQEVMNESDWLAEGRMDK